MFFIREKSIIISLACLPLHKEQNQSCALNAPSPFTQKTTFSPPPALSSQLGFPPPKSCPQLWAFLSSHIVPDLPPLEAARFRFSPPAVSVAQLGSAGGCTGTPEHGQGAPTDTEPPPWLCQSPQHTAHAPTPRNLAPGFGLPSCAAGGIRGFYWMSALIY